MPYVITFPGGKRVDADIGGRAVRTDQPPRTGGEGSAPTPFELFLASIGTCAGIFVLGFCQSRGISAEGVRIVQENIVDPATHRLADVALTIELPKEFPAKYHEAVIRAADQCKVKQTIAAPPRFSVRTSVV